MTTFGFNIASFRYTNFFVSISNNNIKHYKMRFFHEFVNFFFYLPTFSLFTFIFKIRFSQQYILRI